MAKARMLHKTISTSSQVNKLSLPARLLFTWAIAHADDDGRLRGEPEYIKATVVPMVRWSFKKVERYLDEMYQVGLIYLWANPKTSEWFVEFINWNKYQQIKKDRYKPSYLPSFNEESGTTLESNGIQNGTESTPQSNISKLNEIETNKSEYVADKKFFGAIEEKTNISKDFDPTNEGEVAATEAYKALEADHPWALKLTYLRALGKGLPPNMFYQFVSEINQDPTIEHKGKVFNAKVNEWFEKHPQ
jgi:hypothetical protein